MAARTSSQFVIYAAAAGNLLVAVTKFIAAAWTGSAAMFSEGVHSVVDTGNEFLLLYGIHRSRRPPDDAHPLGYGRELYFWSFVVALLIFTVGAGVSLFQGVARVLHPTPIDNPAVSYVVLALSALFEGTSWVIALRRFSGDKGEASVLEAVHRSKDPPSFMVLFEDSAALLGIAIVAATTYLAVALAMPVLDGVASILIGVVLAITAAVLAYETKGLLIGEPADAAIIESIRRLASGKAGVSRANDVFTVHLAPRQILVALSLEFADELRTPEIEAAVADLERGVKARHAEVIAVFVKPQSATTFRESAPGDHRQEAVGGTG
jgi:cation diffusion facilitator family transporter